MSQITPIASFGAASASSSQGGSSLKPPHVQAPEPEWEENDDGIFQIFRTGLNYTYPHAERLKQDSPFFREMIAQCRFNIGFDPANSPSCLSRRTELTYLNCIDLLHKRKYRQALPHVMTLDLEAPQGRALGDDDGMLNFLSYFPNLHHLSIKGNKITDKTLALIAQKYPNLRSLNIANCVLVTDQGILALTAGCKKLEIFNMSSCPRISDKGVITLISTNGGLRKLNLAGCVRVTNESLSAIAKLLPNLESLSLGKLIQISNPGMYALAAGCTQLRSLSLAHCVDIPFDTVLHVAEKCRGLRVLNLAGFPSLSYEELEQLLAALPELETLTAPNDHGMDVLQGEDLVGLRDTLANPNIFTPHLEAEKDASDVDGSSEVQAAEETQASEMDKDEDEPSQVSKTDEDQGTKVEKEASIDEVAQGAGRGAKRRLDEQSKTEKEKTDSSPKKAKVKE